MFSGEVPFYEDPRDVRVILSVIQGKRPTPPFHDLSRTRGLSEPIWQLIETCWAHDSTKRPTAEHVIGRLYTLPNRPLDERPVDDFNMNFPSQMLYNYPDHPFYTLFTTALNPIESYQLRQDVLSSDIKRIEKEARRKEEEAQRKEAEVQRRAEEAERLEREAKAREQSAKVKEEETRKKEAEIRRISEEMRRREVELERREAAEAQRIEEEKRTAQQEEVRKREMEAQRRSAKHKEAHVKQQEKETESEVGCGKEMERQETTRKVEETECRETEAQRKMKMQQEEFRKRELEIRRRAHERRIHEVYPGSTYLPADSNSNPNPGWRSPSSRPGTPASATRTSNFSAAATPAPGTRKSTEFSGAGVKADTAPNPSSHISDSEWSRRKELARKQQEAFRQAQEHLEKEKREQANKKDLSQEALMHVYSMHVYSMHERQWAALPSSEELLWHGFPWPVWKAPKSPEDLTPAGIGAYVLSEYYPGHKSKSAKIKENIRRWYLDRFEAKYLPRVKQEDRQKVQEGATVVVQVLNDMLTMERSRNLS